jgi:hypothetical protein
VILALGAVAWFAVAATSCGGESQRAAPGTVTSPTAPRPHVALVTVYVATTNIAKGTTGDSAIARRLIAPAKIRKPFKPGSAVTDPQQLAGNAALFDIPAHSVIVAGMFVVSGETSQSP